MPILALQGESTTSTQVGLVSFRNSTGAETGWLGFGSSANSDATFMNHRSGGRTSLGAGGLERLTVTSSGNAGIGTTTPQSKLDVRGDIRLGLNAEFRATSGEENLRIIRGVVGDSGNIITGSGFTVAHPSVGNYVITFNTPFAGPPSVTAAGERFFINPVAVDHTVMTDGATSLGTTIVSVGNGDWRDGTFHFIAVGPR